MMILPTTVDELKTDRTIVADNGEPSDAVNVAM